MSEQIPTYLINRGNHIYNCVVERIKNTANGAPRYNVYVARFVNPYLSDLYTCSSRYTIISYNSEYEICEEAIKLFEGV